MASEYFSDSCWSKADRRNGGFCLSTILNIYIWREVCGGGEALARLKK